MKTYIVLERHNAPSVDVAARTASDDLGSLPDTARLASRTAAGAATPSSTSAYEEQHMKTSCEAAVHRI